MKSRLENQSEESKCCDGVRVVRWEYFLPVLRARDPVWDKLAVKLSYVFVDDPIYCTNNFFVGAGCSANLPS